MPFKNDMDDTYHYGIQGAVRAAGFLCERADLSTFVGDVMHWVQNRIRTSSLVIADLTEANPNVYLEVGYAWGVWSARGPSGSEHGSPQVRCPRSKVSCIRQHSGTGRVARRNWRTFAPRAPSNNEFERTAQSLRQGHELSQSQTGDNRRTSTRSNRYERLEETVTLVSVVSGLPG